MAVHPCGPGEDEAEWDDTREVVGGEGRQRLGITREFPFREESVDVLWHLGGPPWTTVLCLSIGIKDLEVKGLEIDG
jgi:hypothetical protein